MKRWRRIGEPELVYDGWRKIFKKTFRMSNGKEMVAEVDDRNGERAVAIIALTRENQVVIARQFRCGPEKIFDELPGGLVDEGEEPELAAVRELREETGYNVGRVESLGIAYRHPWLSMEWHYFIAYECEKVDTQHLEETEDIEIDEISIAELFENARTAKMTDSEAVLLAYDVLAELQKELRG